MKVLFLDVDGVLNTIHSTTPYSISKTCLRRLKDIIKETGCHLVLSSTWRKESQYEGRKKLVKCGLRFIGSTPDFAGTNGSTGFRYFRGHEIKAWLDDHPEVTEYCIVDDDGDMLDSQLRNFVQTTCEHGLTATHAYRIKYILNNGPYHIKDEGNHVDSLESKNFSGV